MTGVENASIQAGDENRLVDPIHHVFGCKHHTLVHYLRLALQDNGIYIHLERTWNVARVLYHMTGVP